jgi:hypothetical protein
MDLGKPSKTYVALLVVVTLAVTACGSAATSGSRSTSVTSHGRPTAIYRVVLTARAEPAPQAAHAEGDAIVALHRDSVLCWRFAHLRGFSGARSGLIRAITAGKPGRLLISLSTSRQLRHKGCIAISPALGKAILSQPTHYYVSIPSSRYPGGAIGGQL